MVKDLKTFAPQNFYPNEIDVFCFKRERIIIVSFFLDKFEDNIP